MKEKFYIVVLEWALEGESGVEISLAETKEKAVEYFNALVKIEKENSWIKYSDEEFLIITENQERFTAYIDGEYSITHTNIGIYPIDFDTSIII